MVEEKKSEPNLICKQRPQKKKKKNNAGFQLMQVYRCLYPPDPSSHYMVILRNWTWDSMNKSRPSNGATMIPVKSTPRLLAKAKTKPSRGKKKKKKTGLKHYIYILLNLISKSHHKTCTKTSHYETAEITNKFRQQKTSDTRIIRYRRWIVTCLMFKKIKGV